MTHRPFVLNCRALVMGVLRPGMILNRQRAQAVKMKKIVQEVGEPSRQGPHAAQSAWTFFWDTSAPSEPPKQTLVYQKSRQRGKKTVRINRSGPKTVPAFFCVEVKDATSLICIYKG